MTSEFATSRGAPHLLWARLRRSGLVTVLRILAVATSFAFFLTLARQLSASDFGVFSAIYSAATIGSYIANVGQHVSIVRFYPVARDRVGQFAADRVLYRSLVIVGCGASIGAGFLCIGTFAFTGEWRVSICAGILLAAMTIGEFACSALRARSSLLFALAPRDVVWRVLVIGLVLSLGDVGLETALAMGGLSLLLVTFPQMIALLRSATRANTAFDDKGVHGDVRKELPSIWASTSITPLLDHVGTLLVALALGPVVAGAFFACDRLARLLSIFLVVGEQLNGPEFARSFHSGRMSDLRRSLLTVAVSASVAAAMGLVVLAIVGPELLRIFNPSYAPYLPVLIVLGSAHLVFSSTGPVAAFLNMVGGQRALLTIRLGWSSVLFGAVLLLSPIFGETGAAIGVALGLIGWSITGSIYSWSRFGVHTSVLGIFNRNRPWSWRAGNLF
jgi:O-antigen/teichoic acid export membrane protein